MTTNNALISRSAIDRIIRCNAHAGRASWIKNDRPQALAAAMLRDEDQQAAQIPFDGFYNSYLTAAFDEGIAHELEWRIEEADYRDCSLTRDELEDCAGDCCISSADAVEIARSWVDRYEDFLTDAANDLAKFACASLHTTLKRTPAVTGPGGMRNVPSPISLRQTCGDSAGSRLRLRPATARTFAKPATSQGTSASASRLQAAGSLFTRRTFTSGVRSLRGMRRKSASSSISFAPTAV